MIAPPAHTHSDPTAVELVLRCPTIRRTFEALDGGTKAHLRRVGALAGELAELLDLPLASQRAARVGGLLHDLGKNLVPRAILHKPANLGPEDLRVIRRHPLDGEVLARSLGDPAILDAIRHHHERLDATGYPDGARGAALSDVARVVAVADVYDALTSRRPYRAALPSGEALQRMSEIAGSKLDPDVVNALVLLKAHACPSAA